MESVTARIWELVEQAKRLRGADGEHLGHRKDRKKSFKGLKGHGFEFSQFASH